MSEPIRSIDVQHDGDVRVLVCEVGDSVAGTQTIRLSPEQRLNLLAALLTKAEGAAIKAAAAKEAARG